MALGLKSRGPEQGLSGVERLHDLHVWAMGTSEIATTAHLLMPSGQGDDAILQKVTRLLRHRFGIDHASLQRVRVPFTKTCVTPCATTTPSVSDRLAAAAFLVANLDAVAICVFPSDPHHV